MPTPVATIKNHRVFIGVVCVLAAMPITKLGDVQLLEVFFLLHFAFLIVNFILRGFRSRIYRSWRPIVVCHVLFLIVTLLLALASLRLHFYPPPATTLLKTPFVLSVARVMEISLGAFYMLYLASLFRSDAQSVDYALRIYFWTGVTSGVYSLLSYPILIATKVELGAYNYDYRARGFFNEGGPYGLFLVSVILVGLLLLTQRKLSRKKAWISGAILVSALLGSQSKAAFLACAIVFLLNLIIAGTFRQRLAIGSLAALLTVVVLATTNVTAQLNGYFESYELVTEYGGNLNEDAYGGFGGRLGGAVLVPRMIADHPWTGIGLGNYPLMRNDPHYLQGLPTNDSWDLPGIGLLSYVAELGIPLFVYLLGILCLPAWTLERANAPALVFVLAAYQPIAHLFGVQLNFYYPWVCTAFALGVHSLQLNSSMKVRQ
jgi:O-Antigen ligase